MGSLKNAYHGGFEQIYALEKVDAGKIRPLNAPEVATPCEERLPLTPLKERYAKEPEQFTFSFLKTPKEGMRSLRLDEPLQVLNLTPKLESQLLGSGRRRLADLLGADMGLLPPEVQSSLRSYLGESPCRLVSAIDFQSLVRCLFGALSRGQAREILAQQGLSELLPRKGSAWLPGEGGAQPAWEPHARETCNEVFNRIADAFLRSWMYSHQGIASQAECEEVLEMYALDSSLAKPVLKLIREELFQGKSPLQPQLFQVEPDLFALTPALERAAQSALKAALGYFYRRDASYPIQQLTSLVERECCAKFEGFEVGFVARCLRLSKQFALRRAPHGQILVSLPLAPPSFARFHSRA